MGQGLWIRAQSEEYEELLTIQLVVELQAESRHGVGWGGKDEDDEKETE